MQQIFTFHKLLQSNEIIISVQELNQKFKTSSLLIHFNGEFIKFNQ